MIRKTREISWGTAVKPGKRWIYIIYPEAYEQLVKGVRA